VSARRSLPAATCSPCLPWRALATIAAVAAAGCQIPDHHLIYPPERPPGVIGWADEVERGNLAVHLEWAKPLGCGLFPTVLVHPEAGKTAKAMRGVIWDLAARGYVAVAADYRRRIEGDWRRNTFPWRSHADVLVALDLVTAQPFVDRSRVATLGFSQGGIFGLLIAAHAPERVRAVVAYYPVTDFEHWFDHTERPNPIERLVYRVIRWHFYRESGAASEQAFLAMLHEASPLRHAERIRAPVLLVHGDEDRAAGVEESRRLYERLAALGREVRLLVVPGGVHIFNFRQPAQAVYAWRETLDWLERHLRIGPGNE
jgi:dienelactone hydrolase